jgi:hypothetical protein
MNYLMARTKAGRRRGAYECVRYHFLHELRRVRASLRVGNTSEANSKRERKFLQQELAKLRATRG